MRETGTILWPDGIDVAIVGLTIQKLARLGFIQVVTAAVAAQPFFYELFLAESKVS